MTHTQTRHYFHIIWSTKNRKNLIDPMFKERLYSYIGGVIKKHNGVPLAIGGINDHVHVLLSLSNLDEYSTLIKNMKAGSSRWVHKEIPNALNFYWQEGYGSFTVSHSMLETVTKYIENQEQHHKKYSFDTEYIRFLKAHDIKFDERFVLD